jgi:predicted nucleotidyltransferase
MLKDMEDVFTAFGIDYYIVGAVARDIHLSAEPDAAALRKTNDVDLAIMVDDEGQFNQLKAALIATGKFTAHAKETIKLFYHDAIEVDLLPFGKIEEQNRNVKLTDPSFVLNMPGFLEVYPFAKDIKVTDNMSIKVCTGRNYPTKAHLQQ